MATSVRYIPVEPVHTVTVPIPVPGVTLSGIVTPHGTLYDVWTFVTSIGLGWHKQRKRIVQLSTDPTYLYKAPGSRTIRTYVTERTLRRWLRSLEFIRSHYLVNDTAREVIRLVGDVVWGDATPPRLPEDAGSIMAPASGGPGSIMAPASGGPGSIMAPASGGPGSIMAPASGDGVLSANTDTTLVQALREIVATLVAIRTDQAAGTQVQKYMSEALADQQGAIVAVRKETYDLRELVISTLADHDKRIGQAHSTALRAAEQAYAVAQEAHPERIPSITFDKACQILNVVLGYDARRAASGELAQFCLASGYPVRPMRAKGGRHTYNLYVMEAVRAYLAYKGFLPTHLPPTQLPKQPPHDYDADCSPGGD